VGLFSFLKKKSDAPPVPAGVRARAGAAGSPHGPATIAGNPSTRMPLDTEAERERQREIARATAAKIDEIELEMASDIFDDEAWGSPRRAPAAVAALAAGTAGAGPSGAAAAGTGGAAAAEARVAGAGAASNTEGLSGPDSTLEAAAPSSAPAVEEAAILYANGQLDVAEQSLRAGLADNRNDRMPWWMLFDLYQAGAREEAFDSIAIDYASHFETSPPAYRAAASGAAGMGDSAGGQAFSGVTPTASLSGCLDAGAGARLARLQAAPLSAASAASAASAVSATSAAPAASAASVASAALPATLAPVRLEFSAVSGATPEGCAVLLDTLQALRREGRELVLAGADHLVGVLRPMLAIGEGAASQAPWLLLLELLLLLNREKDFEETAMDYCVTFEVSPPSFEAPARTALSISTGNGAGNSTGNSAGIEGDRFLLPAVIEGDSATLLAAIETYALERPLLVLDCSRLARIDYGAAAVLVTRLRTLATQDGDGDGRSGSGRIVELRDLNHLVAALLRLLGAAEPIRLYAHRY
jgi:ABC-type transporter Mla MlaB component